MPEWLTIVAALAGGTAGTGGLWGAGKWLAGWLERRAERKHQRELELEQTKHKHAKEIEDAKAELATRLETMQRVFLEALRDVQKTCEDEKQALRAELERHRREHLDDTKLYAKTLAALRKDSSAPSS